MKQLDNLNNSTKDSEAMKREMTRQRYLKKTVLERNWNSHKNTGRETIQ